MIAESLIKAGVDIDNLKGASKNSIKAMRARRKGAKKRSLHGVNEHFERLSNTAGALLADF